MNYSSLAYNEADLDYLFVLFARIELDQHVQGRIIVTTHDGAICSFFFDSIQPLQGLACLYRLELSTLRIMDESTDVSWGTAA